MHNLSIEYERHFQNVLEASVLIRPRPLARFQRLRRMEDDPSAGSLRTIHVETSHAVLFRDPL